MNGLSKISVGDSGLCGMVGAVPTVGDFSQVHYTPAEIAEKWKLSTDVIRALFDKEPGVLVIGDQVSSRSKRRYRTVRIPERVAERVHRRLSKV